MKVKKKSFFISLIVVGIVLIIVGIILLFERRNENENIDNQDNDQQQEQPLVDENEIFSTTETKEKNDVVVSNFKYSKGERSYIVNLDVTNNSDKNYENLVLCVIFYGENNEILSVFDFHLGKFASGESKTIEKEVYFELSNIVDYSFHVIS